MRQKTKKRASLLIFFMSAYSETLKMLVLQLISHIMRHHVQ